MPSRQSEDNSRQTYRKDLSHRTWDEIYQRQQAREPLARQWLEALGVGPGMTLLDMGTGPGFVSMLAADLVGPEGLVLAVDVKPEALDYLKLKMADRGLTNIRLIRADGADFELPPAAVVTAALVTNMLHHADRPQAVLARVEAALAPGGAILVAEFHPRAPGDFGPPLEHRISPERLQGWLRSCGLEVERTWEQEQEHYAVIARRARQPG